MFNPSHCLALNIFKHRLSTSSLVISPAAIALLMQDAMQLFNLLLVFGAGTGLIFILRWFWWRINATTEIIAMIASLVIATTLTFTDTGLEGWHKIIIGATVTTLIWVLATFITPPTDDKTLINFYKKIRPGGSGWKPVLAKAAAQGIELEKSKTNVSLQLACFVVGTITVYAALFATGNWIYSATVPAIICSVVAIGGGLFLFNVWDKLKESNN